MQSITKPTKKSKKKAAKEKNRDDMVQLMVIHTAIFGGDNDNIITILQSETK